MAADFLGTECFLVPLDGLRRIVQHQMGGHSVESSRNGLRCFRHDTSLSLQTITMKRIKIGCKVVNIVFVFIAVTCITALGCVQNEPSSTAQRPSSVAHAPGAPKRDQRESGSPARLISASRLSMGSTLTLTAWTADASGAKAAFDDVFVEFMRLEHLMSTWIPDS